MNHLTYWSGAMVLAAWMAWTMRSQALRRAWVGRLQDSRPCFGWWPVILSVVVVVASVAMIVRFEMEMHVL